MLKPSVTSAHAQIAEFEKWPYLADLSSCTLCSLSTERYDVTLKLYELSRLDKKVLIENVIFEFFECQKKLAFDL